MRSSKPCFADAVTRGTMSASASALSPRKTLPSALIDSVTGFASVLSGAAAAFGRSIGTPAVISGAVTMKMMRSTSMTSMNGVILISLMTPRLPRRRRRRPPPCPCAMAEAIVIAAAASGRLRRVRVHALVDLARQDRRELVGEALEPRLQLRHLRLQLVVGEHRRDRREEPDRGRKQRLGDAG